VTVDDSATERAHGHSDVFDQCSNALVADVPTRATSAAKAPRSRTPVRWFREDSIVERLASHLQHVAFELGQLIEEENAVMRQRPLAGPGELPAAVPADVGDRVGHERGAW
jgi:hypothetical protein